MDEEQVNLIVKAIAEGFQQAADDIGGLGTKTEETGKKTKTASTGFTELKSAIGLAREGVELLKGAYDQTVGSTLTLSDEIRRLSRDIGASAEESSKLIVAADNTGISVDTLTTALDQAIKKGHEPTIANLAKMADAYNAIQSPIGRTKYLMDNFGRAGAEMGALMEKGSAGIRAFGDEAAHTGQIMSQDAVDAAHKYEMSMNDLGDSVTGLKVQVGEGLVPTLDNLTKFATDRVSAVNLLNQAIHSGAITTGEAAKFTAEWLFNAGSGGGIVRELTDAIDLQTQATNYLDAADRANLRTQSEHTVVMADNIGLHQQEAEALKKEAQAAYALQRVELDAASAHDVATVKYAQQLQAARDAIQAEDDALMDHATMLGVSGVVTKNEQAYQDVVSKNAVKMAELRAEIDKYTAAQGASVTVVNKGQYSAEQLAVAQERLAIAEQRLTEYHGKSAASLASLELSVRTAQDAVEKMAGAQATSETTTADYSKKIAEDQAALDDLAAANARAEEAMHKANKEFVIQEAQAGLTGKALYDFELKMGEIDQPTYDAVTAIDAAKAAFAQTGDLGAYESSIKGIVDQLNGVQPAADTIPEALVPATTAFQKLRDEGIQRSIDGLIDFHNRMDALQDKVITITTNFVETHYGPAGVGGGQGPGGGNDATGSGGGTDPYDGIPGYASGANFVVPPGFNNDSYLMRVSSNEHVQVTPPGQGGSSGVNVNIGSVHLGPGTTPAAAQAFGTSLAQQLHAQILAGAQAIIG